MELKLKIAFQEKINISMVHFLQKKVLIGLLSDGYS